MNVKTILKKRWVKITGGAVAAIVLFFLFLPIGTKYFLTSWFKKNGADSVTIEKLRFNPFLGRITMEGMDVKSGGQSLLYNSSMVIDFDLASLFQRDIHLEKAAYQDLVIDLEQYADGRWRFGSYTMTEGEPEQKHEAAKEAGVTPWAFLADRVGLVNCRVRLKTPEFDMTLEIEQADLERFTTREGQPAATFNFKGRLDDGPIVLQLDNVQLVPDLRIAGTVAVADFKLAQLAGLLHETLPAFAGKVGLEGKASFSLSTEKGMQAGYDGTIEVAGVDIGNNDFSTKAQKLKWQGEVAYGGPNNGPLSVTTDGMLAAQEFLLEVPGAGLVAKESHINITGKTKINITDRGGQGVALAGKPAGGITVDYDGAIDIGEPDIGSSDFSTKARNLTWQGQVQYGGPDSGPISVETEGVLASQEFVLEVPGAELVSTESFLNLAGKTRVIIGGSGESDGDGKSAGGIQVDYDGDIDIGRPDIAGSKYAVIGESLKWQGKVQYGGPDTGPLSIMTDGLLAARELRLDLPEAEFSAAESAIDLSGTTKVTIAEGIQVESDGSLHIDKLGLALSQNRLNEEKLVWQGRVLYDSDHGNAGLFVNSNGSLELGQFVLAGGEPAAQFGGGGGNIAWQGAVSYEKERSGTTAVINIDGALTGADLTARLDAQKYEFSQGKVDLVSKTVLTLGKKININGLSSLALNTFSMHEGENPLLSFNDLTVTGVEGGGEKQVSVKELLTSGLQLSVAGNFPLHVDIQEISLTGLTTSDLANFQAGELSLTQPVVKAVHNNEELVSLSEISLTDIHGDTQANVSAKNLLLRGLVFLNAPPELPEKRVVSFTAANLNELSWSKKTGLQGQTLRFDDLVANIVKDKDGTPAITRRLEAMQIAGPEQPPAEHKGTEKQAKQGGLPFKLAGVEVGGKSSILLTDYTLAVPFTTDLAITKLAVGGLDPGKPEEKTSVLLEGELEQRAPLEVSGNVSPFLAKPAVDLQINLKNYPLTSLSAYTVQSVGTALASGQLRLKSSVKLADDNLEMNNKVVLQKLETETIAPELAKELNNQLPLPLDAALSMLRDNEKNIALDIPLSGPVSALNVGISGVLITALSKAIVPAASGYLMYALGPYGALAYVGMKVGERMLEVVLPPVIFLPQQTSLTTEHAKYLERIARILTDRPETDMQLCPVAGSWEFLTAKELAAVPGDVVEIIDKYRDQLLGLGQERAAVVQDHLVKTYAIDKGRLLICDTRIEKEKKVQPSVLLQPSVAH